MSFLFRLVAFGFVIPLIHALAIQPQLSILNNPGLNFTDPSLNLTGPSLDATPGPLRSICNARLYGIPNIPSCLNVYKQMSSNETTAEFGERTKGLFEYPLPYRYISDDALCVIDIEHLSFRDRDKDSMASMRAGALELMEECVFGKTAGGVLMGLGEAQALAVTINTYKEQVTCQPEMPVYPDLDECQLLLQSMPASQDVLLFGDEGDPHAEVELPYELPGPGGKCGFLFTLNGGSQKRSWYDLWEAATSVWAKCGRKKKQGYATVGESPQFIDVFMYSPPEGLSALNSTVGGALTATA